MNICAVVMAAGEGRLMKSKHAKVSHMLAGTPMTSWVRDEHRQAGADERGCLDGRRPELV